VADAAHVNVIRVSAGSSMHVLLLCLHLWSSLG